MNAIAQYNVGAAAYNAGKPLDPAQNEFWRSGWEDAKEFFETFGEKY